MIQLLELGPCGAHPAHPPGRRNLLQVGQQNGEKAIQSMRRFLYAISLSIILSGCSILAKTPTTFPPWYPVVNNNGDPIFAVFEGRIPCTDCQVIKLGLALYEDPKTNTPTTYEMSRLFVGKGNDRTVNEGKWLITSGTKLDPQAVVYQLDSNAPQEFRSFWAIDQDILFILDQAMNPRVGNGAWSYVLDRTH